MKIVVTGSSGRIGSAAVSELLQHGHEVVAIDVRDRKQPQPVETRKVDLCQIDQLRPLLEGAAAVVHMANYPGIGPEHRSEGFSNNMSATFNLFQAAADCRVACIINASSLQAYGICGWDKALAPCYLPVDESHPIQPADAYQLTKAGSELIADGFARQHAEVTIYSLRFTAVLDPPGVGAQLDPLPQATDGATGSLWTYVSTTDAALAIRLCCQTRRPGHTPLNIVHPRSGKLWNEPALFKSYGRVPKFRRAMRPDEALLDGRRAQQVIGFVAETRCRLDW